MHDDVHVQVHARVLSMHDSDPAGGCFGAIIVDAEGKILSEGINHVVAENDPTWHGEVDAIRKAAKARGSPHLRGCVMYTSSEPCPMCMAACYWARVEKLYYASTIHDVKELAKFEDEDFYAELSKPAADRMIPSEEFMREEAIKLWQEFAKLPNPCHY